MFHLQLPITDPTWIFLVVLSIILVAPLVSERLRVPSIIGLIAAGVLIGPHGLNMLERDSSFELFGRVGLMYIMFLAALEMNLQDVRKTRGQAVGYGLLSFALPMVIGVAANHFVLGYGLAASVLMASMYAAHTLLTYPTVMKYGLQKHRAVNVAVGGTIGAVGITLLVLAVVAELYKPEGDARLWLLMLEVAAITAVILLLFPWLARRFFLRYGDSVMQYVFVLALVFLGGGMMELVGMEGILGAFMVGLALNREIPPGGPLMSHIEFLGNALFIPYFLVGVGMIVNVGAMFTSFDVVLIALVMLLCGTGGKWLAAWVQQKATGMSADERQLMFGLSSARAAATLAIVLVGHGIILPDGSPLLGDEVLNAAMFLIVGSCLVSGFATDRAAQSLVLSGKARTESSRGAGDHVLVALNNPRTVVPMTNMALMLRTPSATGAVSAINVVLDDLPETRQNGVDSLEYAAKIATAANVKMQTHCRWSVNPVTGISHAAKEYDATDILIGLHQKERVTDSFFGKFTEDLVATVSQQVLIYRALVPIYTVRRIHIVAPRRGQFDPGFRLWIHRMATLAQQICCRITVYGAQSTLDAVKAVINGGGYGVDVQYTEYSTWHDFMTLANLTRSDHLMVFIHAHKGMPWRHAYHNHLPEQIERYFSTRSVMVIVPARAGKRHSGTQMLEQE